LAASAEAADRSVRLGSGVDDALKQISWVISEARSDGTWTYWTSLADHQPNWTMNGLEAHLSCKVSARVKKKIAGGLIYRRELEQNR